MSERVENRLVPPMRLFDWQRICPADVARPFPAIVGGGRGKVLDEGAIRKARRKLRDSELPRPA